MRLFDDITRTDERPRSYAEPHFRWLNQSACRQAERVRNAVEGWFAAVPREGQEDLRARLRSDREEQHSAAFFELYCHALLLAQGCRASVHPAASAASTRLPDFEVTTASGSRFFLECTSASDSACDRGEESRLNQIYAAIDRIESPDCFVGVEVRGVSERSLPGARIRAFLARHLKTIAMDDVAAAFESGGYDALPRWRFQEEGCDLEFFPIPKSPVARGKPGLRPIGAQFHGFREVHPTESLRAALDSKAGRYGELNAPFVIAVDGLSEWDFPAEEFDVMQALFGTSTTTLTVNPTSKAASLSPSRVANGFWKGPAGVRNTDVSAVLVASLLLPFTVGVIVPVLWHNPWADRPLSPALWLGFQKSPDATSGQYQAQPGRPPWELLGLWRGWPHDPG